MPAFLRLFNRIVSINSLNRHFKRIVHENGFRVVNQNLNRPYFTINFGSTVRFHPSTVVDKYAIFMSRMKRLKNLKKRTKKFVSNIKLGKRFSHPSKWVISPLTMNYTDSTASNTVVDDSRSYSDVLKCNSVGQSNDNLVEIFGKIRQDVNTPYGEWLRDRQTHNQYENGTLFKVVSYNILAQGLLMMHPNLYHLHDEKYLRWDYRGVALMEEFKRFDADILCLQEVEASKLDYFNRALENLGYRGVFKKRTHEKDDGCAIYYRTNKFHLRECASVEYYQPNVSLLNRDNIGIVARLSPLIDLNKNLVVANTHLLFNPKRPDIKLAQMQILLAEIDRIAYRRTNERGYMTYCPVILTGDFNAQPNSLVYKLLICGVVDNIPDCIPDWLGITDACQHSELVQRRKAFRTEMDISDYRFVKVRI